MQKLQIIHDYYTKVDLINSFMERMNTLNTRLFVIQASPTSKDISNQEVEIVPNTWRLYLLSLQKTCFRFLRGANFSIESYIGKLKSADEDPLLQEIVDAVNSFQVIPNVQRQFKKNLFINSAEL